MLIFYLSYFGLYNSIASAGGNLTPVFTYREYEVFNMNGQDDDERDAIRTVGSRVSAG